MRTGSARGRAGHVHEAGFYSSDADFLAMIVPFVTGGLDAGEPVVLGYDERKCDLLRAALPRTDAVDFVVDGRLYATPAGAIEAYRQQFERHLAAGAEQIRIAGDVPHEGNGGRFAGWDRYESAVNVVWQDYPVYSRCLYDATTVSRPVRDVVERTHRRLLTPEGGRASPRYQEVAEFERLPVAVDPLERAGPDLVLVDPSLGETRRRVAEAARERVDPATATELLFAVSEAVTNARLHGRPPLTVTGWTDAARILVRVHDAGPGPPDPLTGLVPAPRGSTGAGLGLWLSHQLTNIDIALLTGADGFVVRLRGGRSPASAGSAAGAARARAETARRRADDARARAERCRRRADAARTHVVRRRRRLLETETRLAALVAGRALDPLHGTALGIAVHKAVAGAVLTRSGRVLPFGELPGHQLLDAHSAVPAAAVRHLDGGGDRTRFLAPDPAGGLLRVTALRCPPGTGRGALLLLSPPPDLHRLTPLDLSVLGLLIDGWSDAGIATRLHLPEDTVTGRVEHITAALDAPDRALALGRAARRGLYIPRSLQPRPEPGSRPSPGPPEPPEPPEPPRGATG
ncbi:MEDS domain-containing protein [Pseudonocardia kujensis]|uniref:anti-sigma factor RsbA family regulatory protein n=1 Tax=Pseudonocardia kujensis TaxID=1128675 RepID=UPI001E2DC065|nr:anti-sigma factor RsbA family regulatory protein [Pseudonocardia kujensis]MCE0763034.1 MEDS domain-containing protein [Pseudonocardia kujensis]